VLNFNLVSLLLIALGAAFLGLQTPRIAAVARVYPLVTIVLVIACALVIAGKELASRSATPPLDDKLAKLLFAPMRSRIRTLGFVAVWLTYTWALPHVGFIVATTCALSISLWLLAIRRPLVGLAGATVFSLIISILFATVLFIPTPSGPVDRLMTRAIYVIQHRGNSNDH
jgi:hypothetical protein